MRKRKVNDIITLICPDCDGTGMAEGLDETTDTTPAKKCPTCKGTGRVEGKITK